MKALIFNHHPDYTYHIWKLLNNLNIDCFFATESATLKSGAKFSSTKQDNKFELISNLYYPEELFPDMKNIIFVNDIKNYDVYFTIDPNIAINLNKKNVIWGAVIQEYLRGSTKNFNFIKITSVQYHENYDAKYLQYFVPRRGKLHSKKFITQLVTDFNRIPITNKLIQLKKNYPVVIAGSNLAPDGIVNDWEILSHTTLLCHEKNWGTNCNSVCKALDTGIPIYISKQNKNILGFCDLPDFMFLYSDDYTIEEAYKISLDINNKEIQESFRELRNVNLSSIYMKNILKMVC